MAHQGSKAVLALAALVLGLAIGACGDRPSSVDSVPGRTSTTQPQAVGATSPPASTLPPDGTPSTTTESTTTLAADTAPPLLTIVSPQDGSAVATPDIQFEGATEPGAAVLAWDQWPADVAPDGSWSIALMLEAGTNIARFTATDAAGNTSTAEIVVTYAPPTTTEPPAVPTVLVTFAPAVTPAEHRAGSCYGPSSFTPRAGAYRCMAGSEIHDPCFATADGPICDADPLSGATGFVLDLTEPLPAEPAPTDPGAWILKFSDGIACRPIGGATGTVDGARIAYSCSDGSWALADLRPGETWTGHRVELHDRSAEVTHDHGFVPISRIWQ